jgi:hypothetical protein
MKLEASPDPDDKACAVYLRVALAEMQIAVYGLTPSNIQYREFYLTQMRGVAHEYGALGPRFADFEMETWTRRVRTYFEEGRKMDAVGAARTGFGMLEERKGPRTPMVDFASGAFDSAVGHASTPLQILFRMAGISGDITAGYDAVMRLIGGGTVYAYEALYMAHHFARERDDSPFGKQSTWALRLLGEFPQNPQYLLDVAAAYRKQGRAPEATLILNPIFDALRNDPERWSPLMRAKLYWIGAYCAWDAGDKAAARALAALCRAQKAPDWQPMLEDLEGDLED